MLAAVVALQLKFSYNIPDSRALFSCLACFKVLINSDEFRER